LASPRVSPGRTSMTKALRCVGILSVAVLAVAVATGQDKKDKNKQLPQNYGKLGLSDVQKKRIYDIQDEYGSKIAALKKQLDDLQKKQREEMAGVLNDDQRDQLKKILSEKAGDPTKPPDKKPVDSKPDDKKPDDKDKKPS